MITQDFIHAIAPIAVANMFKFSILASLTISQAVHESDSGSHAPGNNLFGTKGPGQQLQTRQFIEGHAATVIADFRSYPSWNESILDHGSLFHTARLNDGRLRYQQVIDAHNYREACKAVHACGDATDSQYSDKLIKIIEAFHLDKYDLALETGIALTSINRWIIPAWLNTNDSNQKIHLHELADELKHASMLLQPYRCLAVQSADKVIDTWMYPSWKATTDQKDKDYIHRIAVELRKASGQPVKN
jgi:hypothetical protein